MPLDRGAASKIILAYLGPRELRAVKLADQSPELRENLQAIRTQGFSVTEGEVTPGVIGIAVPIFRNDLTLEGSLGLIITATRKPDLKAIIAAAIRAQKQIESNLALAIAAQQFPG
jgi:DNA-binding IclR family transcriptional regulator